MAKHQPIVVRLRRHIKKITASFSHSPVTVFEKNEQLIGGISSQLVQNFVANPKLGADVSKSVFVPDPRLVEIK